MSTPKGGRESSDVHDSATTGGELGGGNNSVQSATRYIALGVCFTTLAFLTFWVLREIFEPVVWAVILVYATWPAHDRLQIWLPGQSGGSALLMTAILGAVLVIPFIWLIVILHVEIVDLFVKLPTWLQGKPALPLWIANIPFLGEELQFVFDEFEDLQGLVRTYVVPWLTGLSGRLVGMLEGIGFIAAKLFFTLFLMFFFYRDGSVLISEFRQALVIALGTRAHGYIATAELTTRAVVYGIVLTAIVQGIIAGIGYWGVGLQSPVLLTVFTIFAALIPFGTVIVWVSASIWLTVNGEHWAGFGLFLWGALVVSWVDNLVRPLVISRTTRIPFVLVMLGVLGGLTSFGFIGLFVGPVILAIAQAVWREWVHSRDSAYG